MEILKIPLVVSASDDVSDRSDEDFPWGLEARSIHFLWVGLLFCKNNLSDS